MKRKWTKILIWILVTPLLLFILLMASLYVPPVQNLLRTQITAMTSDATGLEISIARIDLRFPLNLLVRGTTVVQHADTLLELETLNVHIQALPLFKGKVEIDDITLERVHVNSANLIEGMQIKGELGRFFLASHGVDLLHEEITLNQIELDNTQVDICLADTTTSSDEDTDSPIRWKAHLHSLKLENVSVNLQMPLDSTSLAAHIGHAGMKNAYADLGRQFYQWEHFTLDKSAVRYDADYGEPGNGFDASHIDLHDITVGMDSAALCGRDMNLAIRQCAFYDRSGLTLSTLNGQIRSDSTQISIPSLKLLTPHSEMEMSIQSYWELIDIPTQGRLSARLHARIGKQDIMLFAGNLPQAFKEAYPSHPLTIHAGTEGNLRQMQISRCSAELPGAFSINAGGELWDLTDSLQRSASIDIEMHTYDMNFLTALTGMNPGNGLVIPDSMNLVARIGMEGPHCTAGMKLTEGEGVLDLAASYNIKTEEYQADLGIHSLQPTHFLPQDSLYLLTASLSAKGRGSDLSSAKTTSSLLMNVEELQYGPWSVGGIHMDAHLKSSVAQARLTSDNALLKMQAKADLRLDRRFLDGQIDMNVDNVDLYHLGIAPQPLKRPFSFLLGAEARRDSVKLQMNAGDLNLRFRAHSTLQELLTQTEHFMTVLNQQIENRHLDHSILRQTLPSAGMHLTAGKENPVSYYLATKEVSYNDFNLDFGFTPEHGINGRTAIYGLRTDTLQLDTVFFSIRQDTTSMMLQGGVANSPRNPQFVFRSMLTGEIRNDDAELTLSYTDEQNETGILFGVNARPLSEGNGKGNGILLRVIPETPIIAFRQFHFIDNNNWIYLHKNMRVYANVDMGSDDGLRFRMQSNKRDTVSLQNMNIELSRLHLDELCKTLPYMPRLHGLFSVEAQYVQTETSLQLSAEAGIEGLMYERQPVGDIGIGVTWLPGEQRTHHLDTYFSYNDEEVMMANGTLRQSGGKDSLNVTATLEHFPVKIANAFIPDQVVTLTGDADGTVNITGDLEKPEMNGTITLDSISVYARQVGARYWFDNRPIQIRQNQLLFNRFAIYTTSQNPFIINGVVDFQDLGNPHANLKLSAKDYTLLDAPRTRESLVYGKIFVDLNATVRGPLDALTMRGNMNLLGNTDVAYVMTDSPLTVEDRLDGLVTFVSFADTTATHADASPTMSLGGMDMIMSVHIDDAVRLRADLSTDRSKFIELEGGGNLNMQYTPQGDISLTGRYTLSGGTLKYSLPVIPLKEFKINSGSYVDWRGNPMNPTLNLKATERLRASVSEGENGGTRAVNFDVSIAIKEKLEAPELIFDIAAPDDATIENELQAMGAEERSKQAIAMLATGIYMNSGMKGGGLSMGSALNSVIQSQINALAGSALQSANANFSMGLEDRTSAETGDTQKDISFKYSQRLFNDRIQIVIGGKVSTGANATNNAESFIDNISLEYRLDTSGTRYVRVFHNKNYESVLDGEITETGAGLILRRKMDRLSELFIFRKKKPQNPE